MAALARLIPPRVVVVLALAATAAGLAVAGLRVFSAFPLAHASYATTSGWEQQPLFDLWRFINDQPLYLDRTQIPFHTAFYNWLFYYIYGPATKIGLLAFDLDAEWLPSAARSVTLIGAGVGITATMAAFRQMLPAAAPWLMPLSFAYAVTLFTGPLVGFWLFTARADLWALALEALAIFSFWRLDRDRPWLAVIAAAGFAYAAWAFKHVNVFALVTVAIFLLTRGERLRATVLVLLVGSSYALTFVLAPAHYFPSLLGVVLDPIFPLGIRNIVSFAAKSLPQILPVATLTVAFIVSPATRDILLANQPLRLTAIGSAISLAFGLIGAFKEGAGEYYFFAASYFLALTAVLGWYALEEQESARWAPAIRLAMAAGWLWHGLALTGVLVGIRGVTSVESLHERNAAGAACVRTLPMPLFSDEQYLMLPWINPSRPVFFLSYNYFHERATGRSFESGGIGALIDSGYFRTVVLTEPLELYDGGTLSRHYDLDNVICPRWAVYRRRPVQVE